jgi:hypothetical protein
VSDVLGITEYTLNFEGLIILEGDEGVLKSRQRSVDTQPAELNTVVQAFGKVLRVTYRAYEIIVTDVFVSGQTPDLSEIGKQIEPPGFSARGVDTNLADLGASYIQPGDYGWRVENIQYREAGLSDTAESILFEVTNTHRFRPAPKRIKSFQIGVAS